MLLAVVWRVLLVFAIPLAMEHDLGPVDAMKLSAKAATSNVGGLVVLFIFEALVAHWIFDVVCRIVFCNADHLCSKCVCLSASISVDRTELPNNAAAADDLRQ